MEEFTKAMMEMIRMQQTQTAELLNQSTIRQRESEERQIQILKFFEEKQTKMEAEFKKQQQIDREQREEERKERETDRKVIEEERKEFNNKIIELQAQSEKKLELLTQVISNKKGTDTAQNTFSQSAIYSALETFHYEPDNELTFENYFRCFGDVFRIDCKAWSDEMKV